jgi:ABC-type antimicrobial peptide transport system permease subunit
MVVGVVKNVQVADPGSGFTPVGAYYYPISQSTERGMFIAMKTARDTDSVVNEVRRAISGIDPELAVYQVTTMAQRMDDSLIGRRVPMLIAMSFGVVALFLAAIGIYGVLAYGVAQRRREIGIRLALGSSARDIFGLIAGEGARIVGVGLLLGLAGAYFAGRAMASQLYAVRPMEPSVLAGVVIVLTVVAMIATLIPARRAAKVNPTVALQ